MAEAATLLLFSEIADRQGLPIPNKMDMKLHLRSYMGYIASRNFHKISLWPPKVFVPAFPLEELLSQAGLGCSLTKVLVKQEEAKMVLHRLIKLGFDGARLFPTYEGAARATAEHTWARISI